MLTITIKKRRLVEGSGVNRPNKKAKQKRPRGTKFISFTCELDKDNCVKVNGLCIAHKTPAGNSKVECLVNAEVAAQLSCGYDKKKVKFKCDICFHVITMQLNNVTCGNWCCMCTIRWKHCGVGTCTFCFERSFASYEGLTLHGKKKIDCIVNQSDLFLPLSCKKKVQFECDVCLHVFSPNLCSVTCSGQWCYMCSSSWKHCGVKTCTFCFERSFGSYSGLTLNDKKKVDCIVNQSDLILPMGSDKKIKINCDVCFYPFSIALNSVIRGRWCSTCKNKTELKVSNYLKEMNITVITQYIPGGRTKMKQNYGKIGKLDYYLPNFNLVWEIDGAQHNMEVAYFKSYTLFSRMIMDKWKEFLVRKEGMNVIRFDQTAIWGDKYDWKQEMKNLLTLTSPDKLRRQLKATKKRYKMYAKEHNDKSKRRSIPEIVKRSHAMFQNP